VEFLRPIVSVNNDFLKFIIFEVLKKLFKNFTSLRICSGLYAEAEHMHQELMLKLSSEHTRKALVRMLSIHVRN
jgi:hypothetical protein